MYIKKSNLLSLWYEDGKGNRHIPKVGEIEKKRPHYFQYMNVIDPLSVRHSIIQLITKDDVNCCVHMHTIPLVGWINSLVGRRCLDCGGTQTMEKYYQLPSWVPKFIKIKIPKAKRKWPVKWKHRGNKHIMENDTTVNEEMVKALLKNGYNLRESMIISATACERCSNVLANKYNLGWGFGEQSQEWMDTKTSCKFCNHLID